MPEATACLRLRLWRYWSGVQRADGASDPDAASLPAGDPVNLTFQDAPLLRPRTDQELWLWVKNFVHLKIPNRAICEDRGHVSPFEFIARAHLGDITSGCQIGPRGGGKTRGFSVLHLANSCFKRDCWTCHVGAIEKQAHRCRDYLLTYVAKWPWRELWDRRASSTTVIQFLTGAKVEVLTGCLPPWQRVMTPDGPKRIAEIVGRKLPGPVKSFNFATGKWEWRAITGWFNNGRTTQWVQGRLDPRSRGPADFRLTAGHEVVLPTGEKVPIGTLRRGDEVCVPGRVLSPFQEQVLLGLLLGDGSIARQAGVLKIEHTWWQKPYLDWTADVFREFRPTITARPVKRSYQLATAATLAFRLARRDWYASGQKRVPAGILRHLNRLGLAVWVMDDGGYTVTNTGSPVWTMCAMSFGARERREAAAVFERFGIQGRWHHVGKRQYVWRCTRRGTDRLTELVRPWIDVTKKGPKGQGWKRWVGGSVGEGLRSADGLQRVRVGSIRPVRRQPTYRYDITVDGTHNFCLASGLLIGNTMNAVSGPRPAIATFDEVEWWDWEIYQQALNMITSQDEIVGQLLLTSTRQKLFGTMSRIFQHAPRTGMKAFLYCIYEVMRPCPVKGKGCPLYDSEHSETGLPRCQMRVNGEVRWRCQTPGGHVRYEDVLRDFNNSDPETWETQKECSRPTRHGLVYPVWDPKVHARADRAEYRPGLPVILGADWGWSAPNVIGFYQEDGMGTLWRFDEYVCQQTLIATILDEVEQRLKKWGDPRLTYMWADGSRPDDCQEFRARFERRGLKVNQLDRKRGAEAADGTRWGGIDQGLRECRRLLRDVRGLVWYYVHPRCTFHIAEFDLYHNEQIGQTADGEPLYGETPADRDNHSMDEWRLVAVGLKRLRYQSGQLGMEDVVRVTPAERAAEDGTRAVEPRSGVRKKEW